MNPPPEDEKYETEERRFHLKEQYGNDLLPPPRTLSALKG